MMELLSGLHGPIKTQQAARVSVLDAFDRHVSRPHFYDILTHAIWLHTWLGSLETFNNIVRLVKENKLTAEAIDIARAEFTGETERVRASLASRMQAVADCAPSDATIH